MPAVGKGRVEHEERAGRPEARLGHGLGEVSAGGDTDRTMLSEPTFPLKVSTTPARSMNADKREAR